MAIFSASDMNIEPPERGSDWWKSMPGLTEGTINIKLHSTFDAPLPMDETDRAMARSMHPVANMTRDEMNALVGMPWAKLDEDGVEAGVITSWSDGPHGRRVMLD